MIQYILQYIQHSLHILRYGMQIQNVFMFEQLHIKQKQHPTFSKPIILQTEYAIYPKQKLNIIYNFIHIIVANS